MPDSSRFSFVALMLRLSIGILLAATVGGCAGPLRPQPPGDYRQEPVTSGSARPAGESGGGAAQQSSSAPATATIRGQSPEYDLNRYTPGSNEYTRGGMQASGVVPGAAGSYPAPASYAAPNYGGTGYAAPAPAGAGSYAAPNYGRPAGNSITSPSDYGAANYGAANYGAANYGAANYGAANYGAANYGAANYGTVQPPQAGLIPASQPNSPNGYLSQPGLPPVDLPSALPPQLDVPPPGTTVPWDIYVQEARTGQFMIGVGVNSDAGVTGQVVLDERNFDWRRIPTSWDDIANGTAWRGAGQGFRLEAVPGNQVQRYLVSFTEPYLFDTQVSLNLSGFFYDRRYFDWDEQRLGGRVAFGYRLTPDLSFTTAVRMENVNIHDPRVAGVADLDAVLGDNTLYSPRFTLTHDTRDVPFLPTEGHFIELSYEQVFGDFDYPRGELDYRKYFLVTERPDGSGRHTLSLSSRVGFSGAQTPIFENYFAGGYSTLRGFDFRGASPVENTVRVGGEFRFLGAVEYMFPLTADDMIRGVAFVDFGTVEEKIDIEWDDFRVAPGLGLRISVPALGPAPIALDFAVPIAREDSDDIENFSFFFGFGRS